jgi:hypothetical protein
MSPSAYFALAPVGAGAWQGDNHKGQHRFKPIAHPNAARPVDYP